MTIETRVLGKAHIIKLVGRLDIESTNNLDATCKRCVENGALHIVFDLSELLYISSAGLGSIMRATKRLKDLGGSVLLCGAQGMVKEVFRITGLLTIFTVFDSPEAACQSIS